MPDRRAIAIRHGLDVVKRRHAIATSTDTTPGGKGSANDRRSRRHVADGGERPRPGGQNETGCLAHPSSHNPFFSCSQIAAAAWSRLGRSAMRGFR